jgi:hypothetical protein
MRTLGYVGSGEGFRFVDDLFPMLINELGQTCSTSHACPREGLAELEKISSVGPQASIASSSVFRCERTKGKFE